uniref:Uncharacterized protein n=1 Tax=Romanomermis culicivorax TaxID=13658 RepID=A0A915KFG5_ROMCU
MFHSVRHISIDEPLRSASSASSKCFKFDDKRFATVSGRYVRQSMDRQHHTKNNSSKSPTLQKRGSKLYSKIIEMNRQSMMELEEVRVVSDLCVTKMRTGMRDKTCKSPCLERGMERQQGMLH